MKKWDERAEENAGIDNPDNYAPIKSQLSEQSKHSPLL